MLAILIDGLTLARAVDSIKTADQIAISIIDTAVNAAGKTKEATRSRRNGGLII